MYITLFITGGILISSIEGLPMLTCLFETASAIGTVGLSMNLTAELSLAGKLIIIMLMFFGRVGPITIVMALGKRRKTEQHVTELPEKKVLIG